MQEQDDFEGKDFVFIKDMAYYVEGKFDMFLEEGFKNFKHTFMIRVDVIPSKQSVQSPFRLSTKSRACGMGLLQSRGGGIQTVAGTAPVHRAPRA